MTSNSTRSSLLFRLKDENDHEAWRALTHRYGEMITRFGLRNGLQWADAEDLRQAVMVDLARRLPTFEYDRKRGRFRAYLGKVARNALFRMRRCHAEPALSLDEGGELPECDAIEQSFDEEWLQHHYRVAMRSLRSTTDPRGLEVFDGLIKGRSVSQQAASHELTEANVRQIKKRIKTRLKALIEEQMRAEDELRE